MPKLKTHRGTAKRMRVTRRGKVMRSRANRNHILTKKSATRKRRLRQATQVDSSQRKMIRELLANG
jgi:large subunit ribosomal protein L35